MGLIFGPLQIRVDTVAAAEKRCCSRLFWLRWQQRSIQVFFLCLWTRVCQVYISKDSLKATKVWVLISGGGWGKRNNNRQFSTIQHLQQQQTHEFCEGWGNSPKFLGSQQQSILDLLGVKWLRSLSIWKLTLCTSPELLMEFGDISYTVLKSQS